MANPLAAVVMAGGLGTRMKSATPKHLHPLLGRRMVDWVVQAAQEADVDPVVVVASPDAADT
jgi:bifunctional UDP-N-acetylglucosamine pyrophosphorylase/glucosamine-1-phosphate N-acetyltransferase